MPIPHARFLRARPASFRWVLLSVCVLTLFVNSWNLTQFGPFFPDYALSHGLDQRWVGIIFGCQVLASGVISIAAPSLIRRSSRGIVLMAGTATSLLGIALLALLAPGLKGTGFGVVCLLCRCCSGFGDGMIQVAAYATLLRIVPENTIPAYTGLCEAMRALASLVGPLASGWLYEAQGGSDSDAAFRLPLAVVACLLAFCLAAMLSLMLLPIGPLGVFAEVEGRPALSPLFLRPPAMALLLINFVGVFPLAAFEPGIEPYLTNPPFQVSVGLVGMMYALSAVADLVAAGSTMLMVGLLGQRPLMMAGACLIGLGQLTLALSPQTIGWVAVGLVLLSFGVWPVFVLSAQLLMRVCRTYGEQAHLPSPRAAPSPRATPSLARLGLAPSFCHPRHGVMSPPSYPAGLDARAYAEVISSGLTTCFLLSQGAVPIAKQSFASKPLPPSHSPLPLLY